MLVLWNADIVLSGGVYTQFLGNHKLIRWRFVVHGGIDGYSRMITFLKCANNNRAVTVGECFDGAVDTYGIPNRVRSDRGGEKCRCVPIYVEPPQ